MSLCPNCSADAYAAQGVNLVNLPDSYTQQVSTLWPRNEIIYTDGSARDTGHPDRRMSLQVCFQNSFSLGTSY